MKPNFALNLSHEGISLLHRAKAGWLQVGDIALDDPGLNDQLKVLRRTAADLESGGLTTKLVIPNSQILYTEVEAPGPDTTARLAQIRDGLVGLTPYDVRELVFDWKMSGTKAQVAVVARETLAEAEAFASEFRFNPVSFVAVPMNGGFDGEPFFGPTESSAALLMPGEVVEPDTVAMKIIASDRGADPVDKAAPPTPDPAPEVAFSHQAVADPEPIDQDSPTLEPVAAEAVAPVIEDTEPVVEEISAEPAPAVTFASRRRQTPPPLNSKAAPAAEPVFAARFGTGARDTLDELHSDPPVTRTVNGRDVTPMPVTAAHTADLDDPADRRRVAREKALAAGSAIAGTLGKIGQGTAAGVRKLRTKPAPVESAPSEADALTVFGARGRSQVRGKPRFLGLILTVLLLMALGILALWSSYFLNDATSGWFRDIEEVPEVASVDTPPETSGDQPAPAIGSPEVTTSELIDPQPTPGIDTTEGAIEAAVEAALLDNLTPDPAPSEDFQAPTALEQPTVSEEEAADIELALLEQPEIASPGPDRISQPPPTRAQAEARYAATGIWQMDPDPLGSPTGGDRLDDVYVASIDPNILSQDAIALPGSAGLLDDLRPVSLAPPPSLGTRFDLDDRGLVRATPEGALTPTGVTVFLGSPVINPGARPGTAPPAEPETEANTDAEDEGAENEPAPLVAEPEPPELSAEQLRLSAIRPTLRPSDLIETTERARLGGFSREELAEIRPTVRPQSLQEQQAAEIAAALAEAAETADEGPIESGTELAVLDSRQPSSRPGNFARLVERAREEAANNPEPEPENEVTASVAPATVPNIPTRASVARQATEQNAINLGKVNLIGVYGSPSDRRALVRLKSGRYVKVEVGDRVDGGRVAAIGDGELRYVKGGRNITLKLPKG